MAVCLICSHEKNREINYALLRGALVTATAKKFAVPVQTLARHRRVHLRFKLRSARGKSQPPSTLEEKLAAIDADLQRLQLEAECSKGVANIDAALRVVKARQNLLELEAKIVGRMPDGGAATSVTVHTGNAQPQSEPMPSPEEMLVRCKEYIADYEQQHALYPGEIVLNAKPTGQT